MGEVCQLCGSDDDITVELLTNGQKRFRCDNRRQHEPREWTGFGDWSAKDEGGESGLAAELGMYDDLPACLVQGEPWVEYGVVERRYRDAHPDAFAELVERYGHTESDTKGYSASAYLAMILGALRDRGTVVSRFGRGTGYWAYNNEISYWALPPGPPAARMLTYEEGARDSGRDPARP